MLFDLSTCLRVSTLTLIYELHNRRKKFVSLTPGACTLNIFTAVINALFFKLKCLPLSVIYTLV
jgi:hypothetical protein